MGIFRDIWMRIKGIKLIPKEAEPNNFVMPENSINQYSVDPSTFQDGKTSKDIEIDKVIEYAKKGYNIAEIQFHELNQTEIQAATRLGCDLRNNQITSEQIQYVGGNTAVIQEMVSQAEEDAKNNQYVQSEAHRFIPSGANTTLQMIEQKAMQEYQDSFRINHKNRVPLLNQLYNSAMELGDFNDLTNEDLINYTSKKSEAPIQVGGENPAIEDVDISAIISLAKARTIGFIDDKTINEVGGPAKLVDEMSARAKLIAKDDNRTMDMAREYLDHPKTVAATMPKIRNTNDLIK